MRFVEGGYSGEVRLTSRLILFALVGCWSVGCGSAPQAHHGVVGLPTAGESIALLLPPGADVCTVSRTGAVSDARRALVRRVSGTGPIAWTAGAPFVAYVEAIQRGYARGAFRAVARVSDLARARQFLEQDAPVRVGFDEESCPSTSRSCWRAHVVDQRTIRLSMGEWDSEIQGAELRCARMAREHPEAIEVGVSRHVAAFGEELGEQLVQLGYDVPGFESELVLEMSDYGITRTERIDVRLDSEAEAVHFVRMLQRESSAAASRRRTRITGEDVMLELGFVWEDLELAERDDQRMRHAQALAAQDQLPLPVRDVDVRNLALVRAQLELHERRMQDTSSNERYGHARALQTLLTRAIQVYPADEWLNGKLAALYLDELHDGAAAAEIATRMLAHGPNDVRAWQLLRRRALSAVGATELRAALIEDGLFDRRSVDDVAEALVGFSGRDYETAEGALEAVGGLAVRSRRMRRLPAPVALPIASVVEALLNFVDEDGPSQHVFMMLEVDATLDQRAWGSPDARVLTWPSGARSIRFGASLTNQPLALREVANGLFEQLNDVDVELVIAAMPMGSDPRELRNRGGATSVRVRAHIEEADLRITESSARADWDALARYVALPFAELEGRLFPPPDMQVEAENETIAAAIVAASEAEPVLQCEHRAAIVECTVSPELDVTRRAWRRVVWPRVLGRSIPSP